MAARLKVVVDLNKSRLDIPNGALVAAVDAEGQLVFGTALEMQHFPSDVRRVRIIRTNGTQFSPPIERVAVL